MDCEDVVVQCLSSIRQVFQECFIWSTLMYFSAMNGPEIQLVECPRDAIQGWPHPITTEDKLAYYRTLLRVGFDTLDMGSFVSPKAIPAMADTAKVLRQLEEEGIWDQTNTKGLVIVGNGRGAKEAGSFMSVDSVGFPFSLSPTFLMRNTNATMSEALVRLDAIADHCARANKHLVVYLSMGFGNPYMDEWSEEMVLEWSLDLMQKFSPSVLSLADTVGSASEDLIERVFRRLTSELDSRHLGCHLHLHPLEGIGKIEAAFRGGCRRFDGAIRGVGGCPMAQDDLVGNAPTELIIQWVEANELWRVQNPVAWSEAQSLAASLFL